MNRPRSFDGPLARGGGQDCPPPKSTELLEASDMEAIFGNRITSLKEAILYARCWRAVAGRKEGALTFFRRGPASH